MQRAFASLAKLISRVLGKLPCSVTQVTFSLVDISAKCYPKEPWPPTPAGSVAVLCDGGPSLFSGNYRSDFIRINYHPVWTT